MRGRCTQSVISDLQSTTAISGVTRCRPDRHSTERWCTAPRTIRTPSARRLWREARRALKSFSASLERSLSCRTLSTRGCSLATRSLEMARSASETLLSSATARTARFSSIHHAWDHTTVFLCCASSRGRHSKCRGGSCSSAVVFVVLSNRQRSTCSCLGCGTSGNFRTARDLCARASGELHLATDPQFTIVLSAWMWTFLCFGRMSGSDCCDDVMWSSILGILTATPAPVVAAPAPVVEYIQLAPTLQTATATITVTNVDMNRVGIPDVLQQPQVGHGAPVLYGAPVNFGSTSR